MYSNYFEQTTKDVTPAEDDDDDEDDDEAVDMEGIEVYEHSNV